MPEDRPEQQALPADFPAELPLGALLGLSNPPNGGWARLRGLQYSHLARVSLSRALSHAMAALVVLSMFATKVPLLLLLGWLAAFATVLHLSYKMDRQLADVDSRPIGRPEFYRQAALSVLLALIWGVPMLVFTRYGTESDLFAVWSIQAMLLAVAALWL